MLVAFLSTSYAILVFNTMIAKQVAPTYVEVVAHHKMPYFKLSVLLLINWFGTFLVPIYFTPSALMFTVMSLNCIGGCIGAYLGSRTTSDFVKAALLVVNLLVYYAMSATVYHGWMLVALIVSTVLAGSAGYASLRYSAALLAGGLTSKQIISVRFWLLWAVTLGFVLAHHLLDRITPSLMYYTGIIGVIAMVLPMYCLQKSVEKLGPDSTGTFMGFTPLVVVAFEYAVFGDFDIFTAIPVAVLPAVIIGVSAYQRRGRSLVQRTSS